MTKHHEVSFSALLVPKVPGVLFVLTLATTVMLVGLHEVPAGTFRTNNIIVDNDAQLSINGTGQTIVGPATALATDGYVLSVRGPIDAPIPVSDAENGEIFKLTLTGTGRVGPTPGADVAGIVMRNSVNFDTTTNPNQSIAIYGEVNSTRSAGALALVNMAFEGVATGGTTNYSFVSFAGKGTTRFDDGGASGPWAVTGDLTQQSGNVVLNSTSGATTINGDTHVVSHHLVVDTTGEFGGALTCDTSLQVLGNAVFGNTFISSINSSGVPLLLTDAIAMTPERLVASGVAAPHVGTSIISGVGSNITLADGTKDGQIKNFTVTSGTGTIVPANLNGGTTYTWAGLASLVLAWDATAGKWVQIAVNGMTLS